MAVVTEIDGRYVVDGEIGGGGMGVVLRARHRFTGAEVAIKMLRPHLAVDPEVQDRFLAEARAPTAIGHKGIVSVIDAGKTPAGELYLVMELLAGRPLRAALTAGGLAPQDVQRIGLELLDALGAAHARGFVHRDLKPENVFLCDPLGSVKLLDFGIAKIKSADAPNPRTQAGALLGTLAYMAPEQLLDARSVDARADLWAVGVMLYEMLTGRLPYDARSMPEMYVALSSTEPTPIATYLPRAPVDVLGFFRRALARDPAQRFQSAKDMVDALATLSILPAARGPGSGVVTAYTGGVWAQPLPSAAQVGAAPLPSAAPAGSAHGTPAGSAHNAPPRVAPTVHVTPQPAAAPRIAAPPPPRRGKGLAIGLGVLSVAAIATAIVVASRGRGGGEPTKPGDEPTIADNKKIVVEHGQDVPLPPVQPAPAQPAPVQPAPQPAPPPRQPQPAPQPQPKPKPVDPTCVAQCKVLAGCGGVAGCVDKCNANANVHACFARVQGCAMLGLCLLDGLCQPRGGATCSQTAQCYAACGKNDDCVCRCTKQASPQVAGLLGQIIACAFECHGDTTCANQRCGAQLQTCSRM